MVRRKIIIFIIALTLIVFILAFSIAGCKDADKKINGRVVIAVSIVPQETFAEAVCGNNFEIITMVPPGASPETYEPSPKEMEQFARASTYFTIGVPAEQARILPFAKEIKDMKIIGLHEKVAQNYPSIEIFPGQRDPHIWLSPKRVKVMIGAITGEIINLDPLNEQEYLRNAESFINELDILDKEIKKMLKDSKDKKFIVFHPAFAYLADDCGLQMYALEQDGKEATPQRLAEIIDIAKKENIEVIFYQSEMSSRQAQAFAEEIGGNTVQLEPLSPDYINNLKLMVKLIGNTVTKKYRNI